MNKEGDQRLLASKRVEKEGLVVKEAWSWRYLEMGERSTGREER